MFYLEDAKLDSLAPLIENCSCKGDVPYPGPGKCFGFYHCEIEDVSAIREADFLISELLIWPRKGYAESKDRWQGKRRFGTFRIYESK